MASSPRSGFRDLYLGDGFEVQAVRPGPFRRTVWPPLANGAPVGESRGFMTTGLNVGFRCRKVKAMTKSFRCSRGSFGWPPHVGFVRIFNLGERKKL